MNGNFEEENEEAVLRIEHVMNTQRATIFFALGVTENGSISAVALETPLIPAEVMAAINGAVINIMEEEKHKRN